MNEPPKYNAAPPSITATIHSVIQAARVWADCFFQLVVLEARKAGVGLALMLGFCVGAAMLLMTGWLALVGAAVAILVEMAVLGWAWSLLLVALLSFVGAGGLVFLAIKRSRDPLFSAMRRQLGLSRGSGGEP